MARGKHQIEGVVRRRRVIGADERVTVEAGGVGRRGVRKFVGENQQTAGGHLGNHFIGCVIR
jgi:hypothetical protein